VVNPISDVRSIPLASVRIANGTRERTGNALARRCHAGCHASCAKIRIVGWLVGYCVWRIAMTCQLRLLTTVWFSIGLRERVVRGSAIEKEQRDDMTSKINTASKK
jgi:hypothetical protein